MMGWGEVYLPAFSYSQGLSEIQMGLLVTLPLIAGACLQLITPRMTHEKFTHKEWVVGVGVMHALLFFTLGVGALFFQFGFLTLFITSSLYWAGTQAHQSAWNFWMGHMIPEDEGPGFFSKRLRFMQVGILLGLVTGGLTLEWARQVEHVNYAFAFLFIMAGGSRLVSVLLLSKQPFLPDWLRFRAEPRFRLRDTFMMMARDANIKKFFIFLFLFNSAVYISAPFVTPFFLARLKLSYDSYMLALAALLVPKILFLPVAQRLIEKIGVRRVFVYSAIGLSPLPAFWMWIDSLSAILVLQALSGIAWAGFEVALMVIFFKNLRQEEKTQMLTLYNLFNSSAVILGGTIGAKLLKIFGPEYGGYGVVFVTASCLRLVCLWPFLKHFHRMPKAAPQVLQSWGINEMGAGSVVVSPGVALKLVENNPPADSQSSSKIA